jgi:uncharacterized protein (TIGR03000 family)
MAAAGLLTAVAVGLLSVPQAGYGQHGGHGGGHGNGHGGGGYGGGGYGYGGYGYGHAWGYSPGFYGYGAWNGGWGGGYYPSYRWGWSGYPMYYGSNYGAYAPYADYRYSDYPDTYFDPRMQTGGYDYGSYAGDANAVHLNVRVPRDAEVWIEGQKTNQTGSSRQYVSPPLTAGKSYTYDIRARWSENGQEVERDRHLTVRAGDRPMVDFTGQGAGQRDNEALEEAPPATRAPRSPVDRTPDVDRQTPTDPTQRGPTPERTTPGERTGTPGRIVPPERDGTRDTITPGRNSAPGKIPNEKGPAPGKSTPPPPPDRNSPPPPPDRP